MTIQKREVLLVIHPTRADAAQFGQELAQSLQAAGFSVVSNRSDLVTSATDFSGAKNVEVAVVLGGDGTILRAAELVRGFPIPILGINMGSVGFLAEIEKPSIPELISAITSKRIKVEPRLVLDFEVLRDKSVVYKGWALNEVTIERSSNQMVEIFLQIDSRPLSRWGCDGVICATPTGSTAYAFSAGGPVVWPEVSAFVLLPLAAHALFNRPMVISPDSQIGIDIESQSAEVSADGMRKFSLIKGDHIAIKRDSEQVLLSHIDEGLFTDRLVAKFKLPVEGWRGERA